MNEKSKQAPEQGATFGRRVLALRRDARMTQKDLAERVGVDVTYISKMENDRLEHPPSLRTIQDLAAALGVDELELLNLANRVPSLLAPIAHDPAAVRFFRHASEANVTTEEWGDLLDYLKERRRDDDSQRGAG